MIERRWHDNEICFVVATGPSLSQSVANKIATRRLVLVSDSYKLFKKSEILYSCDSAWWRENKSSILFDAQRFTCTTPDSLKPLVADKYGLTVVKAKHGRGFSFDPENIHYGSNSGFQAINLAILFGAQRIVLVGFDMQLVHGKRHFFGDHPEGLRNMKSYATFIPNFNLAAKRLPSNIQIFNATPGSALECFPKVDLDEVLRWE